MYDDARLFMPYNQRILRMKTSSGSQKPFLIRRGGGEYCSLGFTLIEVLLVIGVIAILAGIVIVAVNPRANFRNAYDAKRNSEANQIEKAIYANLIDQWELAGGGSIPEGVESAKDICKEGLPATECADINGVPLDALPPDYLAQIPRDAVLTPTSPCTGYKVFKEAERPHVFAAYLGYLPGDTIPSPCGTNICGGTYMNPCLAGTIQDEDGEFSRLNVARSVHVAANKAYVVSGDDDSLTIIDVSDPADPVLLSEVYDGDGEFSRLDNPMDIFVAGNYAYVTSDDHALTIIDVSNPADPVLRSEVYDGDGEFSRLGSATSVFVSGNYAYVTSIQEHALTIMDVSNPSNPVLRSEVYDGDGEFSRLNGAYSVFVSGNYAYVTSIFEHALTIMDVSNPADPVLRSEVYDGDGEFSRLNSAHSVYVLGSYAYVASPSDRALTIMDISNPADPVLRSEVYRGDGEFGRLNGASAVFVKGNYAYITASASDNALTIVDISNPMDPVLQAEIYDDDGEFDLLRAPWDVFVYAGHAYITSLADDALTIIGVE